MTRLEPAAETGVDFSILASCYYEEASIEEFHDRLSRSIDALGRSCEIIYINDGSTDGTFDKLLEIFEGDPKVAAVVDLFRNSGQASALTAGIMHARGKAMVLLDSDLQLDPEELPVLVDAYDRGCDVVSGYRPTRHDSLFRRIPSVLANVIMRKASRSSIRDFGCTFKVFDMRLVRAFNFGPFNPWRPTPVISMAQRITEVPVTHHRRRHGKSGWTFQKLYEYNMENLVNLSGIPFQIVALTCLFLSLLFMLRLVAARFFDFTILEKVTTGLLLNAVVISLLITVALLSAIGEFVIRNFYLLQRRPAFVVKRLVDRRPPRDPGGHGQA